MVTPIVDRDIEKYILIRIQYWRKYKLLQHFGKAIWQYGLKFKIHIFFKSAFLLLAINPTEIKYWSIRMVNADF